MNETRVAVLMGGTSPEHEISLSSGRQVLASLGDRRTVTVIITKDGRWTFDGEPTGTIGQAIDRLRASADVVFVAMHGPFGEDGTVQGLLDAVGLPYTGSGVLGSALAMDKVRAKLVYRALGLPTPESESIDRLRWRDRRAEVVAAAERLGYPCVVKPARSGSSVGVSFPGSAAELASSLDALLKAEEHALAEKKIEGRELTCGILEIAREQRVFALPVTEIKPNPEKYAYFDYEAKYTPGASLEITPAEIPPSLTQQIQTLALAAHRALDCRDFSRTDVLVGGDGQPVLLETNTIPGLTPTSLLPQAAKVAGYDFPRLISILIDNAIIRA